MNDEQIAGMLSRMTIAIERLANSLDRVIDEVQAEKEDSQGTWEPTAHEYRGEDD